MAEFARDEWTWWQKALEAAEAGRAHLIGSDEIPLQADGDPYQGFYRMRTHKDGPFVPVRIWYSGDSNERLRCMRGENEVEDVVARGMWTYAARNPISYARYTEFMKTKVWFDEVVVGEGDKASSSHTAKPAAEKPKRTPRADPATMATASEKEVVQQPAEEPSKDDPDADLRTPEQKAARHDNGHDRYDRFGNEIDDWGDIVKPAEMVRAEAAAQQPDEPTVEETAEQQVSEPEAAEARPVRYWHHHASDRVFAQPDEPQISGIIVPITEEEYHAIKGTHADQAGFDLAAPQGGGQELAKEAEKPATERKKGGGAKPEKTAPPAPESNDDSAENERAVIGGNSGVDPFIILTDNIREWTAEAEKLLKAGPPKNKASADALADVTSKLGDGYKEAEAMRVAEKKPHDDAGKAVQAKFKPVLEGVAAVRDRIGSLLLPYQQEQQRIENARVAEENRRRQEEAEKGAAIRKDFGDTDAKPEPVREVRAQNVKSGNRRAVSITRRKVVKIDDPAKVAAYFTSQKTVNPDLLDVLRKLAHRVLTANLEIEGARLVDEESVR